MLFHCAALLDSGVVFDGGGVCFCLFLGQLFLFLADDGIEKGGEGDALELVHVLLLGSADAAQLPLRFLQLGKLGVEFVALGAEPPFAQKFFMQGRKSRIVRRHGRSSFRFM